jgi:hypothetical protein
MNSIRGWVSLRANLDVLEGRKVFYLYQEQNHNSSATQHIAQSLY